MTKAIFFDLANTLIHKPAVFTTIKQILGANGFDVDLKALRERHKLLSEIITFPDKTNEMFYNEFNKELLYALGIPPSDKLLTEIYSKCSYLPWELFSDAKIINDLTLPLGILSNWDNTLPHKLKEFFQIEFKWILGSELTKLRKPSLAFYSKIMEITSLPPGEILYVGDSVKLDIEPALSLGIRSVLIDRLGIYASGSIPVINNMSEINQFI